MGVLSDGKARAHRASALCLYAAIRDGKSERARGSLSPVWIRCLCGRLFKFYCMLSRRVASLN